MIKNNSNIRLECFNRKCCFNLLHGETVVGGVIADNNDMFTVEQNDKTTREFAISLIESYSVYDQNGWGLKQIRNQLLGGTHAPIIGQTQTKKLVILGAGASADFGASDLGVDIPLTDNLFDNSDLINSFPGAINLKPKILTAVHNGETLEDYFQEKWEEITKNGDLDTLNKLINTQYYIQQYFWNISKHLQNKYPSNYTKLVRLLERYYKSSPGENVGVVTFNYDSLFENALTNILDFKFETFDDYLFRRDEDVKFDNLKPIMLFKPHGSWNWVHMFHDQVLRKPTGINADKYYTPASIGKVLFDKKLSINEILYNIAPELIDTDVPLHEISTLYSKNLRIIDYNHEFKNAFYPNLLIPFKDKDGILMPQKHQSALRLKLENVEEILIIGWKGTEKNFNEILAKKLANKEIKITYVSPNRKTLEIELKKYLPKAIFKHYKGGFTDYLKEHKENPDFEFKVF